MYEEESNSLIVNVLHFPVVLAQVVFYSFSVEGEGREGGRERGREGGREGGKEGGMEGGRRGRKGREGEGTKCH